MKNKKQIKKEILGKIEKNEVKMRPRWVFLAKSGGLKGAWLITIIMAGVILSTILYFIQVYNPIELVEFGTIGWGIFIEDFPYLWLISGIIFSGMALWLLPKIGDNYKREKRYLIVMVAITVMLLSVVSEIVKNLLKLRF